MNARLDSLKNDPLHSWRISPLDWQQSKTYDKFVRYGEQILRLSSRDFAPWYVIEGADERYRSLTVGRILLEGLQAALAAAEQPGQSVAQPHSAPLQVDLDHLSLLDSLDLSQKLDKDNYQQQLAEEQARLSRLLRDRRLRKRGVLALFEGRMMRQARAARSGGSRARWTRECIVRCRSPHRPTKSGRSPGSGASGAMCRSAASSPSSTAPGTVACWLRG